MGGSAVCADDLVTLAYAAPQPVETAARRATRTAAMEAAGLVGLGLLLFAVSVMAVQFSRFETLTAIWPTNAMAFVAVMRSPWSRAATGRLLGVIAIALAAPLILGGAPLWAAGLITIGNLIEIVVAAWLTRRWVGSDSAVTGLGPLAKLLFAAAVVAPAVSASLTAPVFAAMASEREPRLRLAKVDTEAQAPLARRFAIRSIPTLVMLRGGREVARQSGALSAAQLRQFVDGALR